MLRLRSQGGFTLTELLVAMTIMGIMVAVALPDVLAFTRNSRLRAAAGDVYSGVQLARAEAVRRNLAVQFGLTDGVVAVNAVATPTYSATGTNWAVGFQDPTINAYRLITARSSIEGKAGIALSANPSSITFTALGATTAGAISTIDISYPQAGACAANGGTLRCLRIEVSAGGQSHVCDPTITTAGDSRACLQPLP